MEPHHPQGEYGRTTGEKKPNPELPLDEFLLPLSIYHSIFLKLRSCLHLLSPDDFPNSSVNLTPASLFLGLPNPAVHFSPHSFCYVDPLPPYWNSPLGFRELFLWSSLHWFLLLHPPHGIGAPQGMPTLRSFLCLLTFVWIQLPRCLPEKIEAISTELLKKPTHIPASTHF